jgi:hypothetical protein
MSLALINTFATLGTFIVIAATAGAAIVQLRHARSSNQIAAINELEEVRAEPDFVSAEQFVMQDLPVRLQDPPFRHQIAVGDKKRDEIRDLKSKINKVGNHFEIMGILAKAGLVDKRLVLEMWCDVILSVWNKLAPVTAIERRTMGDGLLENFEYLAVLAQDWMAAHPNGAYPTDVRRIGLKDDWLEADKEYAASLAQS